MGHHAGHAGLHHAAYGLTGDTTVGDLINDINGSGKGLVATLDNTGNLVVTDTQNRGTATDPLADAGATTSRSAPTAAAETLTNTTNSSTMDVYLSDSTIAGSSTIGSPGHLRQRQHERHQHFQ